MMFLRIVYLTSTILQITFQQSVTKFSVPPTSLGWSVQHGIVDFFYFVNRRPECAKECFYIKACKSFLHWKLHKTCALILNPKSAYQWTFEGGLDPTYSDKAEWPRVLAGTCADEPCGPRQKCIPSHPPRCVGFCGSATTFENGFMHYGCTIAGCRLAHYCNGGYISTMPDSKMTCQENGYWTSREWQCIANCGNPPSVDNAVVGPGLKVEGANRTYTCQDSYNSNSTSTTILCQANSNWTTPAFVCIPP